MTSIAKIFEIKQPKQKYLSFNTKIQDKGDSGEYEIIRANVFKFITFTKEIFMKLGAWQLRPGEKMHCSTSTFKYNL